MVFFEIYKIWLLLNSLNLQIYIIVISALAIASSLSALAMTVEAICEFSQ
ncbi:MULTISPECIES: hypothetical protein [unclassified Campylobacter]|nr:MULTISPECIES: hypothetical protein [unclassified Campylobacter]MDA3080010.1 hypothetical protein [Campylobacter sp. CS_NA2]MDA3081772.1 hypothetical protein [Campylobacter sp. CS_NA1]MDA3086067.1 hypothetical protein [Campylobacter sp. CS_ED1]MDA3090984.1 hypothetical protein [Campylobacter sp. CS_ED2]WBR51252.1 hypothetical protein PF026_07915 [Campylobacter sp. CS_NA3]